MYIISINQRDIVVTTPVDILLPQKHFKVDGVLYQLLYFFTPETLYPKIKKNRGRNLQGNNLDKNLLHAFKRSFFFRDLDFSRVFSS